jgi:hypothetical protein
MWSPAVSSDSAAFREAFQMLYDRLELSAGRGQLQVSGADGRAHDHVRRHRRRALFDLTAGAVRRPDLRNPTPRSIDRRGQVPADRTTGKRRPRDGAAPTIATAAATLQSNLAVEGTPLTAPEQALMEQWLTTLADATNHDRTRYAAAPTTTQRRRGDVNEVARTNEKTAEAL